MYRCPGGDTAVPDQLWSRDGSRCSNLDLRNSSDLNTFLRTYTHAYNDEHLRTYLDAHADGYPDGDAFPHTNGADLSAFPDGSFETLSTR
jgi:hypothetical protein